MADNGITRIKADVETAKYDLANGYGGDDGPEFGKLLDLWLHQADRILNALRNLQHQMETVLQTKQQDVGANMDAIHERASQNNPAYQTMTGA